MGRIIYSDGRTDLDTTAFRYKLTDSAGTLVKDWTTGATWTEEPAGTYYLDDAAAVPGTRYAVEPATGEVGGAGMVPWIPAAAGDAMTLTAAYDKAKDDVLTPLAVVDGIVDAILADTGTTIPATLTTIDDFLDTEVAAILEDTGTTLPATLAAILEDTATTIPASLAAISGKVDTVDGIADAILEDTATTIPAQIAATDAKVDIVDGILDTTLPLIQRVYRYFFNKRTHTNSSVVVYADDGVTADATMTVSGDTTTVTKAAPS